MYNLNFCNTVPKYFSNSLEIINDLINIKYHSITKSCRSILKIL